MSDDNRMHIEFNPDAPLLPAPKVDINTFLKQNTGSFTYRPPHHAAFIRWTGIMHRRHLHGRAVFIRLMRKP